MKALETEMFDKKGWVDLVYDENGAERDIRLDEYHLARFDEVIDAICERKGFRNPLPVDGADKEHADARSSSAAPAEERDRPTQANEG